MAEERTMEQRGTGRRPASRRRARAQRKGGGVDIPLLIVMAGLMIFGLLMIFSTSAYNAGEDQASFLRMQLLAEVLGAVAIFVVFMMPYSFLKLLGGKRMRWVILGFAVFMLLLLKTPLGITAKGATRWIRLGPLRVQPAEIAKVAVIIFFAAHISEKPERINTLKGYLIPMGIATVLAGLVYGVSKNLSSAIIVMGIATLMMFLGTKDWKFQMVGYPALVAAAGYLMIQKVKNAPDPEALSFRYQRIMIWLDPNKYVTGNGYQTLQALYAIGSGGITGKGIGKGIQKLGTIPEVHNDMIFSVICEELGLVGAVVVLILFAILLYRCLLIALSSTDSYGMLLCMGVFLHIAIQVVLNILVVTNTMPNTGVSLPFISYGGSSVSFLMAEMGLVLRVARENEV